MSSRSARQDRSYRSCKGHDGLSELVKNGPLNGFSRSRYHFKVKELKFILVLKILNSKYKQRSYVLSNLTYTKGDSDTVGEIGVFDNSDRIFGTFRQTMILWMA